MRVLYAAGTDLGTSSKVHGKRKHMNTSHLPAFAAAAVCQIPNTEHMAYRLVRTLVYKRGVGIRGTVLVIKCGRWS